MSIANHRAFLLHVVYSSFGAVELKLFSNRDLACFGSWGQWYCWASKFAQSFPVHLGCIVLYILPSQSIRFCPYHSTSPSCFWIWSNSSSWVVLCNWNVLSICFQYQVTVRILTAGLNASSLARSPYHLMMYFVSSSSFICFIIPSPFVLVRYCHWLPGEPDAVTIQYENHYRTIGNCRSITYFI